MSVKTFAVQMKAAIEEAKAKGTAAIYCDNLIAYLNDVENSPEPEPTPLEIEEFKSELQNRIEASRAAYQSDLEMFKSVIAAGQSALRSSFLLNGGGAVALLAFIGHLAQFRPEKVAEFGACLLPFTFGVLVIAASSGLTYLTQWFYSWPSPLAQKTAGALNVFTIILGATSYFLFAYGLWSTYRELVAYA